MRPCLPSNPTVPMIDLSKPEELAFASIRTLGQALRKKQFSCVELTEFFLQRLEQYGPQLNAVVTITREQALAQARQADQLFAKGTDLGPLQGIPYGAKDLLATRGIPTSWGAAPKQDQRFDTDATVIRKLQAAGAILVAKLAMVEIAGGLGYRQANASFTGPGKNPWNQQAWSGGSSSGSGSAVGAGLVPFAIGTETWGSISTPSGYCGITGLRPTYGRVSRNGAMALSWSMDKIGPMARTAEDCAFILEAIAGHDPGDPSSSDQSFCFPTPGHKKEKPLLATLVGATQAVQPEVRSNFQQSLKVLDQYAEIEEIRLPSLPYRLVAGTIIDCEMAAAFEELVTSGDIWEMTAPEDRLGVQAALYIPAKDYINAQRIRAKIAVALDELLSKYDAIVTPTLPSVANPLAEDFGSYHRKWPGGELSNLSGGGNLAGLPAISLPNGFGERGLPTGLQFVSRAYDEARALQLAMLYQQNTAWHQRRPNLDQEAE